jgi:hypothetical protein
MLPNRRPRRKQFVAETPIALHRAPSQDSDIVMLAGEMGGCGIVKGAAAMRALA